MYGQDVGAAVKLKDGEELSARELQRWVREKVAPLKVPKKVGDFVASFFLKSWRYRLFAIY